MKRVLILDDEPAVVDPVEFALGRAGFSVEVITTLAEGRRALERADLLILDLGLPDGNGMDLCAELRRSSNLPILMLTSHADEVDRVLGLEMGADDYVVKPFSPREVVARVRSILRRAGAQQDAAAPIRTGALTLSFLEHRVTFRGAPVELTSTEFDLLGVLFRTPKRAFTRDDLIDLAYGGAVQVSHRTIDSHIKGIRRRFAQADPAADPIETVRGVGYRAKAVE